MISWSSQLFLSENINNKKLKKIRDKIDKNKLTRNIYLITFASNKNNLFDIYDAKELNFPYYKRQKIHILGLAESKEKAYELVIDMIEKIYNETGDFKVRDYFS